MDQNTFAKAIAEDQEVCNLVMYHLQYSFLLHCRLMGEFFNASCGGDKEPRDDIKYWDLLDGVGKGRSLSVPYWTNATGAARPWCKVVNKQLVHLSHSRSENPQEYVRTRDSGPLLADFNKTWDEFAKPSLCQSERFQAALQRLPDRLKSWVGKVLLRGGAD
jgi:hypothetical protein